MNVGGIDRTIRIVAGVAIIGVGAAYESWWGAVGILPLGTALVRWCPPYSGISTLKASEEAGPAE